MGNLITDRKRLYYYKWFPKVQNDLCIPINDLNNPPSPFHGKILFPYSQVNNNRDFIVHNHHKMILVNDSREFKTYFGYQFRGVPQVPQQIVSMTPEKCLEMNFNCRYCPIPIILERFNEFLLKSYINAFSFYGINVEYYEKMQFFIKSQCKKQILICSNYQLEQLSHRIQSLTYRNQDKQKLTILCFCNKDQYNYPKKTQLIMQSNNIEVVMFHNMLQIIQKIKKDSLITPPSVLPTLNQKILFYLNQNQKEVNYLLKMAKRIEKSIRGVKVHKVFNKNNLIQKIKENQYSIIIFSNDSKEMRGFIDIYQSLEEQAIEDKVIFLKRDSDMSQKIMQRIQNTIINPKYIIQSIIDKGLVFYGNIDIFKFVLKHFPKINFKKFIDCTKENDSLDFYLSSKTEVVMTHFRICNCMQEWKQKLKCKMIYFRPRMNSLRIYEKKQLKSCSKEHWFMNQQQLISYFQQGKEMLYSINYGYSNKKMTYISNIISQIFKKLKQKKTILLNKLFDTILFFSCQYYFLDQMSNYIMKYFTHKTLGNFDKPYLFFHIKFRLYRQLLNLHKSASIQEQILIHFEKDQSSNIFQLSEKILEWSVHNPSFLEQINTIWQLFIYHDRSEHLSNCQILLFLMFLSFNKTNFAQYHNQYLQYLTLKIKKETFELDQQGLLAFSMKTRNSYAYNFNFLLCEQVKPEYIAQNGEIIIKIEGSELNNFGLYLPVWRNKSMFVIAPLTRFELIVKGSSALLKLSLSCQQKMLQRFSQQFLEDKPTLRLIKQQKQMRKLDCFFQNMSNGKLQTAGYILNKLVRESHMKNKDLINAYSILHHLKRGQVQQAQQKLQIDKYHDILSRLIASCRQGSSVEAAHSSLNSQNKGDQDRKNTINEEICNQSSANSMQNALNVTDPGLIKTITNEFKNAHRNAKRNPSQIYKVAQPIIPKSRDRRLPVSVKYSKKKTKDDAATSIIDAIESESTEKQVRINIYPPTNGSICLTNEQDSSKSKTKENINSHFAIEFKKSNSSLKQPFQSSISKLNSGSWQSQVSDPFALQDPINQKEQIIPLKNVITTISKHQKKPSHFMATQSQSCIPQGQQYEGGTATGTGKFNFVALPSSQAHEKQRQKQQLFELQELIETPDAMEPVTQEETEKQSNTSQENKYLRDSQVDFFRFSLGVSKSGQHLFPIKRKSANIPRNSIPQSKINVPNNVLKQKLVNIEQQNCPSSTNPNILLISLSDKQSKDKENFNKENLQLIRTQGKKLFTFSKCEDNLSDSTFQGLKLPLRSESLVLSQDSNICKRPQIDQSRQRKQSLFMMFQQQKSQLQSMNSISSIQLQQAEPVHPQELIDEQITHS